METCRPRPTSSTTTSTSTANISRLDFLPKVLRESLLQFQREGIHYALEKNGRCLFGDEMGLGKTLQAISVAYFYKSEWPLLIVVPSSMRYPWIEELERWLPDVQPYDMNLITSGTDVRNVSRCKISLVGYGLLRNDSKTLVQALTNQAFQVVIVDESHYMKNRKAARTKVLVPLLHKAKRVLLLSGTPALARPAELFTQIDSVQKGLMGSWSDFTKRYCNAHWNQLGRQRMWDTSGASHLDELHKQLVQTVMIRREKKQVLTQLPPKRRQKVPFELADSQEKKELEKCWVQLDKVISPLSNSMEPLHNTGFEVKKLATHMYNLTGKAKIGAVCEYIKMLLDNQGLKFLVFAHHKEVLTALAQTVAAFSKENKTQLKYIKIDGDVPSCERMHLVKQFQTDNSTRVALLSILAAGTGLTLTAASQVVFAELHWTPGILEQCEDRAHRIGQLNAIHVHYLVARGTIDEWLWSALSKKVNVISSTLNGRLEHLRMEEKGGDEVEFLKHAAAWLPSNRDILDEDSFFFTSKKTSKDIRSFFTPGHIEATSKRKRKHSSSCRPSETPSNPHRVSNTELNSPRIMCTDDDDDDDFQAVKKQRPRNDLSRKELFSMQIDKTETAYPQSAVTPCVSCCETVDITEWDIKNSYPEMKSSKKHRHRKRGTNGDIEEPGDQYTARSGVVHGRNRHHLQLDRSHTPKSSSCQQKDHCMSTKVDNRWSCGACTFDNHADLPFCEICSTPRKITRRQVSKPNKIGIPGTISEGYNKKTNYSCGVEPKITSHSTMSSLSSSPQYNAPASVGCADGNSIGARMIRKSEEHKDMMLGWEAKDSPPDHEISTNSTLNVFTETKCTQLQTPVHNQNLAKEIEGAIGTMSQSKIVNEQWKCTDALCGYLNTTDDSECEVCWTPRPTPVMNRASFEKSNPLDFIAVSNIQPIKKDKGSELSPEPEQLLKEVPSTNSSQSETEEGPVYEWFLYYPSRHTDRIYLYDQDGNALNCSFLAIDLQHQDLDSLPQVLHNQHNIRIALRFLTEWNSLNEVKRKQLRKMDDMFVSPLEALEAMKEVQHYQPCTKRYITKDDLAEAARKRAESVCGGLRVITKTRSSASTTKKRSHKTTEGQSMADHILPCSASKPSMFQVKPMSFPDGNFKLTRGSYVQAVDGKGRPLCVFCGKVTCSASGEVHQGEAWDQRYCSESCKDEHHLRWKSSKYVRQQLLEAEHGVCQMCGLEAQQLFNHIKDAAKADRKEMLAHSTFSQMSSHRLNDIIRNPSSGQFWHADHIIAVMDGGGLCSLDNYRTLCVMCHDKVTAQQNRRRRNQNKAAGIPDIRSFFKP